MYYQAYTLNNLGNMAFVREQYAEAEEHLRESIHWWQQLAEPLQMANSLSKLGDVLEFDDGQGRPLQKRTRGGRRWVWFSI